MTLWSEQQTELIEAELRGYEMAAREHHEGKRIGREAGLLGHAITLLMAFVAFAAIGLTCVWVFSR